jgi:type VI secretion system protein VasG
MRSDEVRAVLGLHEALERRVIGQPHAIEMIARTVHTARARLTDPRKPLGAFLMVGTSGVGKTETALALADLLYGGEQNLTVINMSEFKEEHKVSLLMGSPPGYVGYGEGGVLTEAVRRRPYSVVLLDEMEKAHPGVQDVFYRVLDKGTMTDGEGREIDFHNTVIIMTSNAGTDLIAHRFSDPETAPDAEQLAEELRPALLRHFKSAFLGRVAVVPYLPLPADILRRIVHIQLDRIAHRVRSTYGARLSYDEEVVDSIAARCTEGGSGARNVENILSRTLLPEISGEILTRLAAGTSFEQVTVVTQPNGDFAYIVA